MLRCRARFHCAKTPLQREHEEIGGSIRRRARDQSADLLLSLKPCQHQRNCQATFLVVTQDRIQCFPSVEIIKIIQNNFQSTSRKNWKFALVHPFKKKQVLRESSSAQVGTRPPCRFSSSLSWLIITSGFLHQGLYSTIHLE